MTERPRYGRPVLDVEPLTDEQVIQRQEQERQAEIDRQFRAVIPPLFHGARLDDLSDKLREVLTNKPHRQGLLLWGPPGTGKTHTLSAMAYNAIANGTGVQRKTFKDILLLVRATYDGSGTEQRVFERLLNPSILIIEDVAVGKQSEFTTDVLLRVIDSRMEHCKPTWLTSNLSPENIEAMFDERVGSRLETFLTIKLGGQDKRKAKV